MILRSSWVNIMNLKNVLQKLMVIVAVLLLIACFVTGAPIETEEPSQHSFLWMLTLIILVGAVGLCISGTEKPLGWVIVGSFIGAAICLCEILDISRIICASDLFFILYLVEFLLSTGYGVSKRIHIFD